MPGAEPITRKVLVINFRPAAIPAAWSQAEALIPQYIEKMKEASGNQLVYQVVKKLDTSTYPVLPGTRQYDDVSWGRALHDDAQAYRDQNKQYLMADYQRLIQEYDFRQVVQGQQADEIWMFGGPYFGFYESCMIGRGAFWCNGPGINLDCSRCVVMGFNYQRSVREMVHDYGHRAERILAKHFGSEAFVDKLYQLEPTPPPKNPFEQFLLKHGTVHREPGGEEYKQNEFAWLSAMQPDWWPLTIDPNQVQTTPGWYVFLSDLISRFWPRR
jgi:hypothetical protein